MTAEGARSRGGRWVMRPWLALRRRSSRTSLRTKLIATLLALVVLALAAMGFAGISLLRSQLLGTYSNSLQQEGTSPTLNTCLSFGHCPSGLGIYVLTSGGQLQTISAGANGYSPSGTSAPELPSSVTSWLANHPQQSTTVPASGGGQSLAMGFAEPGGTLILTTGVTGVYTTIRQLTGVDLIVSVIILFVLTLLGFAVVQANLRPLVEI